MPHSVVKLAKLVVENSDNYSECVIARAKSIIEWNNNRRELVAKMWREYHQVYKQMVVATHGKSYNEARSIRRSVLQKAFGNNPVASNDFHKCKNVLRHFNAVDFEFTQFTYSVTASMSTEIEMMHRYMCCVNARRFDNSLEKVSFLRLIPKTELAEIILFRFLKNKS